jgi:hypothetical protein
METYTPSVAPSLRQIDLVGFALMAAVFEAGEVDQLQAALCEAVSRPDAAVIQREGAVVGARNLVQLWPGVADIWRRAPLVTLLMLRARHAIGGCQGPPVSDRSLTRVGPAHCGLSCGLADRLRQCSCSLRSDTRRRLSPTFRLLKPSRPSTVLPAK